MSKDWRIVRGNVLDVLPTLDDASVDLTVTSPPYFQQKDYGVAGQIGIEESLDAYLSALRTVFVQLLRVTASTGSCFFVVGDTYRSQKLMLVPHRLAILADEVGWTVRNDLIWSKLDPPPESPKNRWRASHEHILFLTKRPTKYKFNADAIRVPYSPATLRRWGNGQTYGGPKSSERNLPKDSRMRHGKTFTLNPKGCLPTDVWSLPSGDSSDRHYATFSERLISPIIQACTAVGDLVLDPFAGTGTTCRVAKASGRRCLGIELSPAYVAIAEAALEKTRRTSGKTDK